MKKLMQYVKMFAAIGLVGGLLIAVMIVAATRGEWAIFWIAFAFLTLCTFFTVADITRDDTHA